MISHQRLFLECGEAKRARTTMSRYVRRDVEEVAEGAGERGGAAPGAVEVWR